MGLDFVSKAFLKDDDIRQVLPTPVLPTRIVFKIGLFDDGICVLFIVKLKKVTTRLSICIINFIGPFAAFYFPSLESLLIQNLKYKISSKATDKLKQQKVGSA